MRLSNRDLADVYQTAARMSGVRIRPGQVPWLRQLCWRWVETFGPDAERSLPEMLATILSARRRG